MLAGPIEAIGKFHNFEFTLLEIAVPDLTGPQMVFAATNLRPAPLFEDSL